jgi:hypothetical protein
VSVFDVSQSAGDPLPEIGWPILAEMPDERRWDHLAGVCEAFGLKLDATSESANGARGWYQASDRSVTIVDTFPLASQARTLVHELAHSLDPGCHDERDATSQEERELVAESVAYVVGKRLGAAALRRRGRRGPAVRARRTGGGTTSPPCSPGYLAPPEMYAKG